MPTTRRRRIVRRAAIAVAVVALLPVWYVSAALTITVAHAAGWIPGRYMIQGSTIQVVFRPLNAYTEANLPGTGRINQMGMAARDLGRAFR
jgi:hypothetical protein